MIDPRHCGGRDQEMSGEKLLMRGEFWADWCFSQNQPNLGPKTSFFSQLKLRINTDPLRNERYWCYCRFSRVRSKSARKGGGMEGTKRAALVCGELFFFCIYCFIQSDLDWFPLCIYFPCPSSHLDEGIALSSCFIEENYLLKCRRDLMEGWTSPAMSKISTTVITCLSSALAYVFSCHNYGLRRNER